MSLVAAQPILTSGGLEEWSVELVSRFVDGDGRLEPDTRGRIAQAEASGAIAQIDARVLRAGLDLLRATPRPRARIQLNVSPRSLVHPGFVEEWAARIGVADLERGRLVVEVDASAIAGRPCMHGPLRRLHSAGAAISLDDASGTPGVLDLLDELPVAQVKLAGEDVRAAADGDPDGAGEILRIALAARLHGVSCLAQGVETETELGLARDVGADLVQGNLLGHAVLVAGHRPGRCSRAPRASRRTLRRAGVR